MTSLPDATTQPPFDDEIAHTLVGMPESLRFEVKRVKGDKLTRALETVVAFANTEGGYLVLGLEDSGKEQGRARIYGVQENPCAVDELRRFIDTRITPPIIPKPSFTEIGCTLRDGSLGSIVIVQVAKSDNVHSITLDGTWQRLMKGNKELVAEEITQLALERGRMTAEERLVDVDFGLLNTDYWRMYASARRITRPLPDALEHLGLAKKNAQGSLLPTWAAVLLFAQEPGGLLRTKASVRVFHYKGERVEHGATPNLLKPPKSFNGPLVTQIADTYRYVLGELAAGVQMGPLGFEIVQKYPTRVIKEAITNAVIHRDYSLQADIQVRIFADHIEVVSPGVLPGKVTTQNIRIIGSFSRNPLVVSSLREFPDPPNLDAGEGVRMMFQTMDAAGLYPPVFLTRATIKRDEVLLLLLNEYRPTTWDQVTEYLQKHGVIGNAEVRRIMGSADILAASKALKNWVDRGLLEIANPDVGKRSRRYKLPEANPAQPLFADDLGKQIRRTT